MENQASVQTSVQTVDLDIDSWLGAPGADSIVTPTADDKKDKPGILSTNPVDLKFLNPDAEDDTEDDEEKEGDEQKPSSKEPVSRETIDEIVKEIIFNFMK